jgi:hypothetical protein
MKKGKGSVPMAISGILGILFVAYGMIWKNHPVFLLGIGLAALGYLLLRKKLKHTALRRFE